MTRRLTLLTVLAFAALAAPASAGQYAVYACGSYGNHSWTAAGAAGISADTACQGSDPMGLRVGSGVRVADGATATETFTAPSGMTIADFTLTRQLTYRNGAPASGTRRLYAIYKLGGTVFAGAGHYQLATRDRLHAQGSWYGYPENNVVVPRSTVSRASFPALAGYTGNATSLQIVVGCFNGATNTACTTAGGGAIGNLISGARVVLNDPTKPAASVEASGLLAGGRRNGSDAVTLDASDNGGIRRVEILDLSGGGIVGGEDYGAGARTRTGATCSPRIKKACPNLSNETIRPTKLAAGRRTLKVRVTDAAGNITETGPYVVDVVTPSDRGPLNGSGATDGGTLTAQLQRQAQAPQDRRLPQARAGQRPAAQLRGQADLGRPAQGPHARPPLGRALRPALGDDHEVRRQLQAQGPRRRLAPRPGGLGVAHPRPQPAGERLPHPQRPRVFVAARDAPGGPASARRCGCAARCAARSRAAGCR